jgi:hypothetical protein
MSFNVKFCIKLHQFHVYIVIGFLNHRQARSSLYANTQLRAHRRAEEKKIKSKTNKINKEYN